MIRNAGSKLPSRDRGALAGVESAIIRGQVRAL